MTSPGTARRLWALGEPYHALLYFSAECLGASTDIGLHGFWNGYFAARAAPLGAVGAEVVTATFYNFAPGFVARRVPAIWTTTTPEAALQARLDGMGRAGRRVPGGGWAEGGRGWAGVGGGSRGRGAGGQGGGHGGAGGTAPGGGEPRPARPGRAAPRVVAVAHHAARTPRRRPQRRAADAGDRRRERARAGSRRRPQHPE